MNKLLIVAAVALTTPCAFAQSSANSNTHSQAQGIAQNAGNAQSIQFNSSGPDSVRTTPSVGGQGFYGSFSPDNCDVSTGGGFAGGLVGVNVVVPTERKGCTLLRGYERTMQGAATFEAIGDHTTAQRLRQASIDMLCQVSDEVGQALRYQGLCSDFDKKYDIPAPMPVILAAPTVAQTIHMRINQDGSITETKK